MTTLALMPRPTAVAATDMTCARLTPYQCLVTRRVVTVAWFDARLPAVAAVLPRQPLRSRCSGSPGCERLLCGPGCPFGFPAG